MLSALSLKAYRRSPAFLAGILFTLALGIGANTAVFSLVEAVLLRPLPYRDQDRLVMLWRGRVQQTGFSRSIATPSLLQGWRESGADVVDVAGIKGVGSLDAQMDYATPAGTERLRGAFVTPNFFDVLGSRPSVGRLFTAADDAPGLGERLVLGHAFWQRAFGGDPGIVGRQITLTSGAGRTRASRSYTVVGVLPPDFKFTYPEDVEVMALIPWAGVSAEIPNAILYQAVGRLRDGVSFDAAAARLTAAHAAMRPQEAALPDDRRSTVRLERIADSVVGDTRPTLGLLAGIALVLLLITCATVANALFIRVTERQREMGLRAALGASRARLIRQVLGEGLALSTVGVVLGVTVAAALMPVLRTLVPPGLPRGNEITLNAAILIYAALLTAFVTILAALAPALRGAKADVVDVLKRSAGSVSADRLTVRWRQALVAAQAGLAAALLVAGALLVLSFWRLAHVQRGFDGAGVLTAEMRVVDARPLEALRALQDRLVEQVRAIPGVADVGLTTAVPFRGVDFLSNVDLIGKGEFTAFANNRSVDAGYFRVMRIPLMRGRLFSDDDRPGAMPVALVSESFARKAFGGADPVGRQLWFDHPIKGPVTVVGVVGDLRNNSLAREPMPAVYVARAQHPNGLICLVVRPHPGTGDLSRELRGAIRIADPALPAMRLSTIEQIERDSTADRRFYTAAAIVFAALALLLTVAGLTVVVGRAVVERTKELAIRASLGATGGRLRWLVLRQGLQPVAAGVAAGLAAAVWAAPALAPFLYNTAPRAPWIYVVVGLTITAAAAGGGLFAALRVGGVTPATMLRSE